MNTSRITSILVVLLLITSFHSDVVNCALSAPQLSSCEWLINQYGLNIPLNDASICSSGYFTCSSSQSDITSILINPSQFTNEAPPDPYLLTFTFPELISFQVDASNGVASTSLNALNLIKNLPKLQSIEFNSDDSITTVPSDFPTGLPLLTEVRLHNNNLQSIPTFFNNSNIEFFSVYGKDVQSMVIDSTLNLPELNHIDMDFNPLTEQTYTIASTSIPKLQYLSLDSSGASMINIQIQSRICDQIFLESSGLGYRLNISEPDAVVDIELHGKDSALTPSDLTLYTTLGTISLSQVIYTTYPLTSYPKSLTSMMITNSQLNQIPNITIPSTFKLLDLSTNLLAGTIPWSIFSNLSTSYDFVLNVENNPNLSDAVPDSFCSHRLKSFNTSLTLPECFMCYIGDTSIITTSIPAPSTCNITFDTTDLVSINGVAVINGNNIGFGNVNSNLTATIPNKRLTYNSNSKVIGPRKPITLSLNPVLPQRTYPFTIIEGSINMTNNNNAIVNSQGILITFEANFFNRFLPHTFSIFGQPSIVCSFVNLTNGNAACQINGLIPEGVYDFDISNTYDRVTTTIEIKISNQDKCTFETLACHGNGACNSSGSCVCYQPTFYNNCSKPYPFASSGVVQGTDQTLISLIGDFGIFGQQNPTVLINGTMSCMVTSKSQSYLNCTLPTAPTTFGYAFVNITVDSLSFNSPSSVLYFTPPPVQPSDDLKQKCIDDTQNCYGHGECNDFGKCICDDNYNPVDFCYTQYANTTIQANTTSPTTSFDINGIDFSFEIIAIQELDIEGKVVKEVSADLWDANITTNNDTSLTTATYQLNITSNKDYIQLYQNTNITAVITFSSQPRVVQFGDQDLEISPNSIKLSVNITNWQYSSNLATLRVVFKTTINDQQTIEVNCQEKDVASFTNNEISSSLQYLRVVKDNVQFNGRFIDYVLSDGHQALSKTYLINQTSLDNDQSLVILGITMPLCQECILDPDFTPLIIDKGNDDCNAEDSKKWRIIVGVVVGGVGAIGIAATTIILIKKKRSFKRSSKDMKRKLDRFA